MAKNPLGKIKDAAVESLKAPAAVAGSAVGLVKGAAATGGQVTKSAADAVTSLVGGEKAPAAEEPAAPKKPKARKATVKTGSKPVNVTKELGLDPVPVEKPKPAKKAARQKAITSIDAAVDPSTVDVTPADVASVVSREQSGGGSTS